MLLMVTIIISLLNELYAVFLELYAVFLVKTTVSGEALDE